MSSVILLRIVFMAAALGVWFWTQKLLGLRPIGSAGIGDRVHQLTEPWNRGLHENPKMADGLLIGSSFLIDALGLFVMVYSIFGPTLRPFVALLMIFGLRQLCQASTALPPPPGIIWRDPHVPSFLVTYGVSNDLFFSGHTAIAVLGSLVLASLGHPWLTVLAVVISLFEIVAVLVLRAHYTLDVFTGAVVAFWIWGAAPPVAQAIDGFGRAFLR